MVNNATLEQDFSDYFGSSAKHSNDCSKQHHHHHHNFQNK
jgi:hypothetical protein